MEPYQEERRGLFDGLKVPHSLRSVLVAAGVILAYTAGVWGIESAAEVRPVGGGMCRLLAGMLGNVSAQLGPLGSFLADVGGWQNVETEYPTLVWLVFGLWTALAWAFLAAAVQRQAAVLLAREEGISLREMVRFAAQKTPQNLLSLGFVALVFGFFVIVINALVAGVLGRVPYLGDVLVGVLFVLVLVSTILAVGALVLGVAGFNLAGAAIAADGAEAFDAVTRAWNYVLSRPWQMVLTYLATFLYLGVVIFAGHYVTWLALRSLSLGDWGLGRSERLVVQLDADARTRLGLPGSSRLSVVYLPGKAEFLEERVLGRSLRPDAKGSILYPQGVEMALEEFRDHVGRYPTTAEGLRALLEDPLTYLPGDVLTAQPELRRWSGPYLTGTGLPLDSTQRPVRYIGGGQGGTSYELISAGSDGQLGTSDDVRGATGIGSGRSLRKLDITAMQEWTLSYVAAYGVSGWVNAFRLFLAAYVLSYFLSAQTTVYFLLRHDVEGDDYSEIAISGEEEYEEQPLPDAGEFSHGVGPGGEPSAEGDIEP